METMTTETNGSTLSWASLNLNEVDLGNSNSATRTEVPAGNYKFRLLGAKDSPFQQGATDIDLVISEGPQQKRHVFASLPTLDKGPWVAQAAAILVKSLGGSKNVGENLVDCLNRLAQNGAGAITADVEENHYNDRQTGEPKVGRPKVRFFSVQPAA
jgi:hypothetical protein